MEDLFRFLMMRPADEVAMAAGLSLKKSTQFQEALATAAVAEEAPVAILQAARQFVDGGSYAPSVEALHLGERMEQLRDAIEEEGISVLTELAVKIAEIFEMRSDELIEAEDFEADERTLTDAILAIKLLPEEHGRPLAALTRILQTMALVKRVAVVDATVEKDVPAALNATLVLPRELTRGLQQRKPPETVTLPEQPDRRKKLEKAREDAGVFSRAVEEIMVLRADDLRLELPASPVVEERERQRIPEGRDGFSAPAGLGVGEVGKLKLKEAAVGRLSKGTERALRTRGLSAVEQSVEELVAGLDGGLMRVTREISELEPPPMVATFGHVGGIALGIDSGLLEAGVLGDAEVVGDLGIPTTFGDLEPAGVGELLLVKQQIKKYQGGDIAHIENILEGESKNREHRRLRRTEEFTLEETETEKEEERDLQSTDRFELQKETQETLKQEQSIEAGLKVSGGYGPFIQFEANAKFAAKKSKERSTKTASKFSKEIVSKSVSKFREKVRQQRSLKVTEEVEETNQHGFDNPAGNGPVIGVYQWVDKIYEAQVYNYGLRTLYDLMVPEPAAFLTVALQKNLAQEAGLTKPIPFTLKPNQLTEYNYHQYVQRYQVTDAEPPPEKFTTVSKAFSAGPDSGDSPTKGGYTASEDLVLPNGYEAIYGHGGVTFNLWESDASVDMFIGRRGHRFSNDGNWRWGSSLDYEVGSIPITAKTFRTSLYAAAVEVNCRRTARAMDEWRHATHASILNAYLKLKADYEEKLAELVIQEGIGVEGRNPKANRQLERGELKKACISLMTQQHFNLFDSIETGADGRPQIDLDEAKKEGPYIRFFEQAFEWENMAYVFYPYFWGRKNQWVKRIQYQDADPQFMEFVMAGAARVVVPARPGFEGAVEHFLTTGQVWGGGELPDITNPLYLPIVEEIKKQLGAPGDEEPRGEPWEVTLPTTLVRLRPDGSLPTWSQDASGAWVADGE
jgi:hypothetical protein